MSLRIRYQIVSRVMASVKVLLNIMVVIIVPMFQIVVADSDDWYDDGDDWNDLVRKKNEFLQMFNDLFDGDGNPDDFM